MDRARADLEAGEFKRAATALNHLVFAEPENQAAADALANVYAQMAYLAESGPWRNFYLTGAQELRGGIAELPTPSTSNAETLRAVPLTMIFDLMAVRLDPDKAENGREINMVMTDTGEEAHLFVSGGALHHRMGTTSETAPTLTLSREDFDRLSLKEIGMSRLLMTRQAKLSGNPLMVRTFFDQFEEPPFWFEIVWP